jgi:hypothetical protein
MNSKKLEKAQRNKISLKNPTHLGATVAINCFRRKNTKNIPVLTS